MTSSVFGIGRKAAPFIAGIAYRKLTNHFSFFEKNSHSHPTVCLELPSLISQFMKKFCFFTNQLSGENFFSAIVIISPLMEEILTGELFEKWVGRKITRLISSNPIDIRIGGAVLSALCFLSLHILGDLTFSSDCSAFKKKMQDVFVFGLITSAIRNLSGSSLNSYLFHAGNNFLGGLALHRLNYELSCTRVY